MTKSKWMKNSKPRKPFAGTPGRPLGWEEGRSEAAGPHLPADPGLLQKELLDPCALDHPAGVEVDVDVLPEAAGVVVVDCLGVSKG